MTIANLRQEYAQRTLGLNDTHKNPLLQFQQWFDEAVQAQILEPNAMIVATCDAHGRPSARVVLLKGVTEQGFVFYTNYDSRKGQQLAENPAIALVFNWLDLQRQVRIEGIARRVAPAVSDAYFESRPRGSQLGAIVSPQSQVVENRAVLEASFRQKETLFKNVTPLPRPEHWGGYEVVPQEVEFWQGRKSRLHDRIRYAKNAENQWFRERLAP